MAIKTTISETISTIVVRLGLGLRLPLAVVDAVSVAISKTMSIKTTIAKTIGTIVVRLGLSLRLGLGLPLSVVDAPAVGGVAIAISMSVAKTIGTIQVRLGLSISLSLPLAVVDAVSVAIAKAMAIKT